MNVENTFPSKSKEKVFASTFASTLNLVFPLFRYAQATQMTLATLGLCQFFILCKNSNSI